MVQHPDASIDNASRISRLQIFSDMDEKFQFVLGYVEKYKTKNITYMLVHDKLKSHCYSNFSHHLDRPILSDGSYGNMSKDQFDYCQRFNVLNVLAKYFQDNGKSFLISEAMKDVLFTDMKNIADTVEKNSLIFSSRKSAVWEVTGLSFDQCQTMTGAQPR